MYTQRGGWNCPSNFRLVTNLFYLITLWPPMVSSSLASINKSFLVVIFPGRPVKNSTLKCCKHGEQQEIVSQTCLDTANRVRITPSVTSRLTEIRCLMPSVFLFPITCHSCRNPCNDTEFSGIYFVLDLFFFSLRPLIGITVRTFSLVMGHSDLRWCVFIHCSFVSQSTSVNCRRSFHLHSLLSPILRKLLSGFGQECRS